MQITGDISGNVYLAGMNEMGGGLRNRANKIYRSTDGGNTWTNPYTGPTFPGPGVRIRVLRLDVRTAPPIGGTRVGVSLPPSTTSLAGLCSTTPVTGDPGDVYYIRSTDGGVTFAAPFKLNTNTDPSAVAAQPLGQRSGTLLATWYDETPRTSASCQPSSPTNLLPNAVAEVQR